MASPDNKSFLAGGINSWSPWSSRTATPKPPQAQHNEAETQEHTVQAKRGGDHKVSSLQRLSMKNYPQDCPPLAVRWFHAVDIPKRKPKLTSDMPKSDEKPTAPKKWAAFTVSDSKAIESMFQKLSEGALNEERKRLQNPEGQDNSTEASQSSKAVPEKQKHGDRPENVKVPVNEDFLFDVDIDERELAPAYWLGPVYDVRRGLWFYQEGSSQRPCDENLANQLEEGFIKTKPWIVEAEKEQPSSNEKPGEQPASQPVQEKPDEAVPGTSPEVTLEASSDDKTPAGTSKPDNSTQPQPPLSSQIRTYRLFGAHMNSVVTYQDATTAWLLTDDLLSRMSSTVYQRFAGGGHLAGVKLTRGYVNPELKPSTTEEKRPKGATSQPSNEAPSDKETSDEKAEVDQEMASSSEKQRRKLERTMSSLVESREPEDPAKQEEELRRRQEKEIMDDYKDDSESQERDIEHLLLVTHGIGQRLGLRLETVNFVHDVNTLRKALKSVYALSPDLQALNDEAGKASKNCRVQVLPICWRHLLDFPKQSLKHNRAEHDLGDSGYDDQDYPNLDDITVEGVPAIRNLITDLALDILLYQSPAYKGHISRIVLRECNRICALFKKRNPNFKGKISLVGHSLGSAIMFDLLCKQKDSKILALQSKSKRAKDDSLALNFEVEDFYALGSPIGLFQMLKGRTIVSRQLINSEPPETPRSPSEDPFAADTSSILNARSLATFDVTMSSPKCQQIFNIFHPTDPVAYRLEPLISSAMSELKPQLLPYTKKGIFGAPVAQGLTGIGARVGQSVTGLWTNLSAGIANSVLNRSLGITAEDTAKLNAATQSPQKRSDSGVLNTSSPSGSPSSKSGKGVADGPPKPRRQLTQDMITPGEIGEHPPTLIDTEIETLFSGFQKQRSKGHKTDKDPQALARDAEWQELEEKSKKLRREDVKLRALNSNGRIDYSIQEGTFDISMLASIASHMSYWADEDVSHFMISQLLARNRVIKEGFGDQ